MKKSFIIEFLRYYECPVSYAGFKILVEALAVAVDNVSDINTNMKSIYIETGRRIHKSRVSMERDLQTLSKKWNEYPKFSEIFSKVPTNGEMISELAYRVLQHNSGAFDLFTLDM